MEGHPGSKKVDDLDTPMISKSLPIIRWIAAFCNRLHPYIGVRSIPLAYVILKDLTFPAPCPDLTAVRPYSDLHRFIKEDLTHRESHSHGILRDDNASVYYKLDEATRNTAYADSMHFC